MLESDTTRNDEISRRRKVDIDDRIVCFCVRYVTFIIDDAAVFAHFEFVAIIIGRDAIPFVFSEIVRIEPEIVVEGSAVLEHARREIGIESK